MPAQAGTHASHPHDATARTPAVTSRLPHVGTTIFTVMSALATQCGAVNLGQGFPDFDGDPRLMQADLPRAVVQELPAYLGAVGLRGQRAAHGGNRQRA